MNNLRKYIKNFGFVNRVVWLTIKYSLMLKISSDKRIIKHIQSKSPVCLSNNNDGKIENKHLLRKYRKVDKVIRYLPLMKSCLLRSLVKISVAENKVDGYQLTFSVRKDKDQLLTHCFVTNYQNISIL